MNFLQNSSKSELMVPSYDQKSKTVHEETSNDYFNVSVRVSKKEMFKDLPRYIVQKFAENCSKNKSKRSKTMPLRPPPKNLKWQVKLSFF